MKQLLLTIFVLLISLTSFAQSRIVITEKGDSIEVFPEATGATKSVSEQDYMMYFRKNLHYPINAKKLKVSGTLMISFILDSECNYRNIHAVFFDGARKKDGKPLAETWLEKYMETHNNLSDKKKMEYIEAVNAIINEGIRMIKNAPKYNSPAMYEGKPVAIEFSMPFRFKL